MFPSLVELSIVRVIELIALHTLMHYFLEIWPIVFFILFKKSRNLLFTTQLSPEMCLFIVG